MEQDSILIGEIEKLMQENEQLKERIGYLERSNNRREDEIMSLREELIPIKKEVLQQRINKAIEYINKFEDSPEYIDTYDITYWQDEVKKILKGVNND